MTRSQRRQHLVIWALLAATIVTLLISALMMQADRRSPRLDAGMGDPSRPAGQAPGAHP